MEAEGDGDEPEAFFSVLDRRIDIGDACVLMDGALTESIRTGVSAWRPESLVPAVLENRRCHGRLWGVMNNPENCTKLTMGGRLSSLVLPP